jgi:transcriptional regulator with PAS, ATPase and Fis domain
VEKAIILSDADVLDANDFYLNRTNQTDIRFDNMTLEEEEKVLIQNALERNKDNLSAIAAELGITRPTLYSKIKKYNL